MNKKLPERDILEKECDRLFSLWIRKRDEGKKCCTCGCFWKADFQCGHYVGRTHLNTRWDEKNAHGQCVACNSWNSGEPKEHGRHIDKLYGDCSAEDLRRAGYKVARITPVFLIEKIKELTEKLDKSGMEYRKEEKFYKYF